MRSTHKRRKIASLNSMRVNARQRYGLFLRSRLDGDLLIKPPFVIMYDKIFNRKTKRAA